ncbi:MAG TPA: hypothetical protein PK370_02735 [Candidatus Woesebacteria bacterium]|nr:hypothetical protein [Candidatus Woesebacteria bacterium]HPJ17268.1 hypothetical protein [Candidatus Woesebacteria bacterium]
MKIYFSASRLYKESYFDNYQKIVKVLKSSGGNVFDNTGFVASPSGYEMPDEERKKLYQTMLKGIEKADFCVFEASYPSTIHIGHEITIALEKSKPVIVLYTKNHEPILFKGIDNDKINWIEYNDKNIEDRIGKAIEEAKKNVDVRFNFFVNPKILTFLDWIAKEKKIPRSVFLRDLIEREMKKEKDFKG